MNAATKVKNYKFPKSWREQHIKASQPDLYDLGMRIKNGKATVAQIASATGLSTDTIRKISNFDHGGCPWHSTIVILNKFFAGVK